MCQKMNIHSCAFSSCSLNRLLQQRDKSSEGAQKVFAAHLFSCADFYIHLRDGADAILDFVCVRARMRVCVCACILGACVCVCAKKAGEHFKAVYLV